MPLTIIEANEPIEVSQTVITIYGPPGVGKSSLGFSAHDPLLLDTDRGAHRSAFRRASVRPQRWADIAGITEADVAGRRTLVLDTAGRALDMLSADIIRKDAKKGKDGSLTLQGYGVLKGRFIDYLTRMRDLGLDVVLIAHSDEKQQGDDIIERIDMQGGSKQEVYKSSDAMARLGFVNGKRVLSFAPSDTRFGKDPAGFGQIEVPDLADDPYFLGGLIDRLKLALNEQSLSAQTEAARAISWNERLQAAAGADAFTALVADAATRPEKERLLARAESVGFRFDKELRAFVAADEGAAV